MSRALAGDLQAFELLVGRYRTTVRRVAARIVGEDEADDVAQDAFLRAFHRLGQFRGDSPFRSWLLRIAQNAALNELERRRPVPVERADDSSGGDEAPARTPAAALEERERRERLRAKLTLMQPAHRAVLVLRDLEGLSYDEIASVTQTPLGSVKGRLHRARRELVDMLRANTYDWEVPAYE